MKLIKKVNYILAIFGIAYGILYFTGTFKLSPNVMPFYLGMMMLLDGIEKLNVGKKKAGFPSLTLGLILLSGAFVTW